jgi:FkbM family methyltransferase
MILNNFLRRLNIRIVRNNKWRELHRIIDVEASRNKWSIKPKLGSIQDFINANLMKFESKAQLQQDLLAIFIQEIQKKEKGFFVEFGGADGITYSNTFLLEKSFEWTGIVSEPAKIWHKDLTKNRKCIVDFRCVWSESRKFLQFNEVKAPEYSTLDSYSNSDHHQPIRNQGKRYSVETVSLEELLSFYDAPRNISYLSIDTEGSEYSILQAFDFSKFTFDLITVEHNFTESRLRIKNLLNENGYIRILDEYSEWDDWYVSKEVKEIMDRI